MRLRIMLVMKLMMLDADTGDSACGGSATSLAGVEDAWDDYSDFAENDYDDEEGPAWVVAS